MSNSSSPQASFSFTQQQQQQYGDYSNVSPQLYTKDELIIKIPGSVQSMSPTRLPPTPTSEASKAVDISPIVAYDNSGSPMAMSRAPSDNLSPPPSSSSTWPAAAAVTTTTEVTTWSSSFNDTPDNNDDIHFAAQGYDSWFYNNNNNNNKTSSFNVSPAAIPSPQHSTDRLATRSTTSTTSFTPDDDDDDDYSSSQKASSKMYSDHMDDEIRPPTSPISPTTRWQQKNTNNPWNSATLVDSWEGFQPFVQTVKPTPVMKHPKKYRQPDDILQPLNEEPQKEEGIDNNNDPQQQQEQENDTQQQQPMSSGSSDQYEDALSSPIKSEHEAVDQQDSIKMTFDDVEVHEPTWDKNKADHVDDDDDDDDDWVYSREQATTMDTHHVRRYSRDELIDMQPQLKEESVLGQGAKERIDNFISIRQA